jgi:NAD(P)-dependent dehydrogenase (short-subunit alcohol dehydrogenase family)
VTASTERQVRFDPYGAGLIIDPYPMFAPVPWVEAIDISNVVLFLACDESRYITGVSLPVDAGALLK